MAACPPHDRPFPAEDFRQPVHGKKTYSAMIVLVVFEVIASSV
jgi:hypothetical protein